MTKENKVDFVAIKQSALPTTLTDIEALIAKAVKQGNTAQSNYQVAACAVIQHLGTHKDIRVVRKFIDGMPQGLRADSMAKFLDLYAAISVDEEGNIHYNAEKPTLLGAALEKPWWKAKMPTVYKPFNFIDELENLYTRASKRLEHVDAVKGDDLVSEDLNKLRDLISTQKRSELRLAA